MTSEYNILWSKKEKILIVTIWHVRSWIFLKKIKIIVYIFIVNKEIKNNLVTFFFFGGWAKGKSTDHTATTRG